VGAIRDEAVAPLFDKASNKRDHNAETQGDKPHHVNEEIPCSWLEINQGGEWSCEILVGSFTIIQISQCASDLYEHGCSDC
jgi:hypothetical protein